MTASDQLPIRLTTVLRLGSFISRATAACSFALGAQPSRAEADVGASVMSRWEYVRAVRVPAMLTRRAAWSTSVAKRSIVQRQASGVQTELACHTTGILADPARA
ncbi:MAG: hypothetical protein QOF69_2328 [Solirubrobacteraceae bacterium]|nr:hypothetical protein [Solirubrobacteraceae bacterium]